MLSLTVADDQGFFDASCWDIVRTVGQALVQLQRPATADQVAYHLESRQRFDDLLVDYYQQWMRESGPVLWRHDVDQIRARVGDQPLSTSRQGCSPAAVALLHYTEDQGYQDALAEDLRGIAELDSDYRAMLVNSVLPGLRIRGWAAWPDRDCSEFA